MEDKETKHSRTNYSEAFKRQVVSEYESGLSSKATLKLKYGIFGHSCVDRWLEKYGKLEYRKYSSIGLPMKDKDKQHFKDLEVKIRIKERLLKKQLSRKDAELKTYK